MGPVSKSRARSASLAVALASYRHAVRNRRALEHRGQFVDLAVDGAHRLSHLRIGQQARLDELRLELVAEVDQALRAVDQGHPHLRLDLLGSGFDLDVADPRAFDAVPNHFLAFGPSAEPLHAPGHVPQFARHGRPVVHRRVDVERNNVASFDVLGIVLGVIGANPPAIPAVPGHTLAQVQEHRPCGILAAHALDNRRRFSGGMGGP